MVIRIAVVEDDPNATQTMAEYLTRYGRENQMTFQVQTFSNAIAMLENYSAAYDLIFMDIRMPYLNGMDAARRLRELDPDVLLIFITSLTQYAVSGYEVDALDYIVKPVSYYDFALKLSRAVKRLPERPESSLLIPTGAGVVRLSAGEIRYVESEGHHVIYHTATEQFRQYSTLSSAEERLKGPEFARCNSCYLVNLRYVLWVKGYTVALDTCELKISQPRKKGFLQALKAYCGETKEI